MDALADQFKNLCLTNRDGSQATQASRFMGLQLIADDLKKLGFKPTSARSLKPKHLEKLVADWQQKGLSTGTIKNRASWYRWALRKMNKASAAPKKNKALGIGEREYQSGNKSQKLDMKKLQEIPCERMRMSIRLMAAFGLRREEALKFRPSMADKGDHVALAPSWTKGGRARNVPLVTERQRALLDEAKELAGNGSMIPDDKSYIQHRKAFEYQTLKAGFRNLHGLRHAYAQARYESMTGQKCPKNGGPSCHDMTRQQYDNDRVTRHAISEELGHGRLEITRVYLG